MNYTTLFLTLFSIFISTTLIGQGSVEQKFLTSIALADNLIGDDPSRSLSIYLPPSYYLDSNKRYPVVYFLHGYTDNDQKWYGQIDHWINLPKIINAYLEEHPDKEMIFVTPDAYNRFKGSMYSSSITIGDWENFITQELVRFMDEHYRTLAQPEYRGLAGHSMGGYGAIRLGMKNPHIFSSIYLLSPCCMEMNVNPNAGLRKNTESVKDTSQIADQPFFVSATLALSAAWAPNANAPPLYLDLPFEDGNDRPEIVAKFQANSILPALDQNIFNLRRLNHIGMDVGDKDWNITQATKKLHEKLLENGISHSYESYEGDHTNRIAQRIADHLLPFFSEAFKQ